MIIFNIIKALIANTWIKLLGYKGPYAKLKKDTMITFEHALPQKTCIELIKHIDLIVEKQSCGRIWQDDIKSDTRILGFEKDITNHINHFYIEEEIYAIEKYLGRKVNSWFLMANKITPKINNHGSGGGLHRDSPYFNQVKCIWYLNDVSSKNGPFQYIPNSHHLKWKKRKIYPFGKTRFNKIADKLIEVHAKAGTKIICDTKCIHGGKPIINSSRYAVTLYTFPNKNASQKFFKKSGITL